jgi:hypothetical protein
LIAQILSLLLAGSGAANASLHFECNVSAPILQAGMIYLGLAIYCFFRATCLFRLCSFTTTTSTTSEEHGSMNAGVVQEQTQEMIQQRWKQQEESVGRRGEEVRQQQQQMSNQSIATNVSGTIDSYSNSSTK